MKNSDSNTENISNVGGKRPRYSQSVLVPKAKTSRLIKSNSRTVIN